MTNHGNYGSAIAAHECPLCDITVFATTIFDVTADTNNGDRSVTNHGYHGSAIAVNPGDRQQKIENHGSVQQSDPGTSLRGRPVRLAHGHSCKPPKGGNLAAGTSHIECTNTVTETTVIETSHIDAQVCYEYTTASSKSNDHSDDEQLLHL